MNKDVSKLVEQLAEITGKRIVLREGESGWYPPGAENDSNAPYNQSEDAEEYFGEKFWDALLEKGIEESLIDKIYNKLYDDNLFSKLYNKYEAPDIIDFKQDPNVLEDPEFPEAGEYPVYSPESIALRKAAEAKWKGKPDSFRRINSEVQDGLIKLTIERMIGSPEYKQWFEKNFTPEGQSKFAVKKTRKFEETMSDAEIEASYNKPELIHQRSLPRRTPAENRTYQGMLRRQETQKLNRERLLTDRYNKYVDQLAELQAERDQLQSDMENDPDVIAMAERGEEPVEYSKQMNVLDRKIEIMSKRMSKIDLELGNTQEGLNEENSTAGMAVIDTPAGMVSRKNTVAVTKKYWGDLVESLEKISGKKVVLTEETTPQFKRLIKRARQEDVTTVEELDDLINTEFTDESQPITGADYEIAKKMLKISLKQEIEKAKPAQEKLRNYLLQHPGATRKQILEDLYDITAEAARMSYNDSGAHAVENILSRALYSGLIRMDNSVKPAKWYAVENMILKESILTEDPKSYKKLLKRIHEKDIRDVDSLYDLINSEFFKDATPMLTDEEMSKAERHLKILMESKKMLKEDDYASSLYDMLQEMETWFTVKLEDLEAAKASGITTKNNPKLASLVKQWGSGTYDNDPDYMLNYLLELIPKRTLKEGSTNYTGQALVITLTEGEGQRFNGNQDVSGKEIISNGPLAFIKHKKEIWAEMSDVELTAANLHKNGLPRIVTIKTETKDHKPLNSQDFRFKEIEYVGQGEDREIGAYIYTAGDWSLKLFND